MIGYTFKANPSLQYLEYVTDWIRSESKNWKFKNLFLKLAEVGKGKNL